MREKKGNEEGDEELGGNERKGRGYVSGGEKKEKKKKKKK